MQEDEQNQPVTRLSAKPGSTSPKPPSLRKFASCSTSSGLAPTSQRDSSLGLSRWQILLVHGPLNTMKTQHFASWNTRCSIACIGSVPGRSVRGGRRRTAIRRAAEPCVRVRDLAGIRRSRPAAALFASSPTCSSTATVPFAAFTRVHSFDRLTDQCLRPATLQRPRFRAVAAPREFDHDANLSMGTVTRR